MKHKFWKFCRDEATGSRVLKLNGVISDETWYGDEVTPGIFNDELHEGEGDITVWIDSPGGDCFAAAQIYNMLKDYKGKVTVRIDSLAASAASVIAMAGDTVEISPVAMMMIHNPVTLSFGNAADMQKAIDMLNEVKASIMNAYQLKTGLSRNKISKLMDDETWFNAKKAVELGFADSVLYSGGEEEEKKDSTEALLFSRVSVTNSLENKLKAEFGKPKATEPKSGPSEEAKQEPQKKDNRVDAEPLKERLFIMSH
ncbi:head maturation protease, ClpP-related [uncultured Dialister sp.]|uniref:head maturation protease, ClpP-related n=1 Tax=Dialister succinatiphilus TaxID=487173 RepID=UPI00266FEF50|nr:head maturation protease, ClpP-related [uncultured Dialister sp.]